MTPAESAAHWRDLARQMRARPTWDKQADRAMCERLANIYEEAARSVESRAKEHDAA